jgi:transposase
MTYDEWAFLQHLLTGATEQGDPRLNNHRRVLDGIFWIAPRRDPPEELGNCSSVWRQF